MPEDKKTLIAALEECALLMELAGENPFKSRAYQNAARTLEGLEGTPGQWMEHGSLQGVKGIGKGLIEKIEQWVHSGTFDQLEELRAQLPAGLLQMSDIPGLGPKSIKTLWQEKGISSIEQLEQAARAGELAGLPRFGEKLVQKILAGIEQRRKYSQRHTLGRAAKAAQKVREHLQALPATGQLVVAGSLRRARETVKDLDFLVTSDHPQKVMDAFVAMPEVEKVVAHGATKSSVLLHGGIPVDLRVVEQGQMAAALNYFTGSKEHNTALRGRAKGLGLKLNEYGLFREQEGGQGEPLPTPDEPALYAHLGLAYIEPELREDHGEIQAAEKGTLPRLIEAGDMRGVLHVHTTFSDGQASLGEMAQACRAAGYAYLGVCDHSQTAAYAHGLKPDDVARQADLIDELNAKFKDFRIFKGIESDILPDGSLDYDDELLARFDLVVISIHSSMQMEREAMTQRICRAMEHPAATILGHPTGRLLLRREAYEHDMDRIIQTAARTGTVLEINANPWRLDLDWRVVRQAKAAGCRFAINPDAHEPGGVADIAYGVGIARKGWLEAPDVINTMTRPQFEKWLSTPKGERANLK